MEISSHQRQQIALVAQEIGAVFIVIFGSYALGAERPDSDLDIAILTKKTPDYALFTSAFGRISDVFAGKNVDVRFLNGADPLFTMQVVRDGILLYGDQDDYDVFRMLANRRYIDDGAKYFPFQDELIRENQERLEAMIHD